MVLLVFLCGCFFFVDEGVVLGSGGVYVKGGEGGGGGGGGRVVPLYIRRFDL